MTERELFLLAIDLPEAARPELLDRVCAGQPELRREVEGLLAAAQAAGPFLNRPHPAADPDGTRSYVPGLDASDEQIGSVLAGKYKLLQVIGEGGMGVVYMAQQSEPVQRRVAIKLIKVGMDSKQVLARFEAERQALALMDHPNIAKVLDAGTTGGGRPYFAMELVKGVPITKYCDDAQLTPRQRLELFVPVSHAIQHAHQKGIIHRDIKPSNVMVTLYDGRPVPKVIDFGVAKAIEQRLTERTLFTNYGTMVGTLEYMSPEQAEISALGIDTRSDIYSLGVLLYELLTGSTPLTRQRIKEGAYAEILRIIKEEDPPRPSTRLSNSGDALASISAQRHMEPSKLTKLVRGELDWIVMKCLEKDRNRRYETANAFAADLQRYLADETVQACPPSAGYRLRKFARRNKASLAMASLGLAFLVLLGSGLGWFLSERSNRRAATALHVQQALAESETLFRDRKLTEAELAAQGAQGLLHVGGDAELRQRVADWLRELSFASRLEEARLLASGINEQSRLDYEATAREYAKILHEYGIAVDAPDAIDRIRSSPLRDQWTAAIDHWASLPNVKVPLKGRLLAIASGADDDVGRSQIRSDARREVGALKKLALAWESGNHAPTTLILLATNLSALGEKDSAIDLLQSAQRRYPSDFWINHELAFVLLMSSYSRLDDAIRFQTAAVALRPQSPSAHLRLAQMLDRRGSLDEAMTCFREAIRRKPEYSHAYFALGRFLLFPIADYSAAAATFSKGLEFDPDHVAGLIGRGAAYGYLGEWDKALADSTRAIAIEPERASAWFSHSEALRGLGRRDEAVSAYSKTIELQPDYVAAYGRRAELYVRLGQHDLAAADRAASEEKGAVLRKKNQGTPQQRQAVAEQRAKRDALTIAEYTRLIEREPNTASFWQARGFAFQQVGQWQRAVDDYSHAIELKFSGAMVWVHRAEALLKLDRPDEAIADLTRAVELRNDLAWAWHLRGVAYTSANRPEEAVADLEKAVSLDPGDLNVRQSCARAFVGLKKFDRAIAEYSKLMELSPRASYYPLERGNAYRLLGQSEKAIADFTLSIQAESKSSSGWSERGRSHSELGRWDEAARDYAKAVELEPTNFSTWHFAAVCQLGAGDQKSFQATCAAMLARFGATKDRAVAQHVVLACVAGPIGKAQADRLVALAQVAASVDPDWTIGFRGAALYRAGQYAEALECFEKKAKQHRPRASDLLFASLAHHRLGNVEKAKELRVQAAKWMTAAGKFNPRHERVYDESWESWQEELEASVLLAEAAEMRKGPDGKTN